MAQGDIDFGGSTLVVKDIKVGNTYPGQPSNTRQTVTAGSALTLNRDTHAGKTILLSTLTGSVVILPTASGTGDKYRFFVSVAPTSNNHVVKAATGSVASMVGVVFYVPTTIAGAVTVNSAEAAGGTDDTITMNGTTGGGIAGTYLELTDIATDLWLVQGNLIASGTVTTVFSATV